MSAEIKTTPARNIGPETPIAPQTVSGMLDEAAENFPDYEAVAAARGTLTHAELGRLSNVLARRILAHGIGPADTVCVVARRGVAFAVAAVAVIKAGAAYAPIDPSHPEERIRFIVDNCCPGLVITAGDVDLPQAAAGVGVLDVDVEDLRREATANPAQAKPLVDGVDRVRPVAPADPCYIIYTSGTTGTPKGVVNNHLGAACHLQWFGRALRPAAQLRWLQKAPISFDVSVAEIFGSLANGGCVVMPPADWWPGDVDTFVQVISKHTVTVLSMVPSLMRVVADVLDDFGESLAVIDCLRFLLLGGEAVPGDLAERCLDEIGCRVLGLYGPTEAAMDVTCVEYTKDNGLHRIDGCILGDPEDNVIVHILDDNDNECSDGEVGELYLAGAQLADGYLGDEEKTAAAFVSSPFAGDPNGRMYRTGDLAMWCADSGQLMFVGRVDDQVKIRGNRLTLGEVEQTMRSLDTVTSAACTTCGDGEEKTLHGFVVLATGSDLSPKKVKEKLAERLPGYMVPTTVTVIDALPVTGNGKLDRRTLAEMVG